jgi:predicted nucleic acid-binding Zn ribbon protein
VVGEKISAHTNVLRVEEGVLFVGVDASTWCNELTFLKTKIKNKINSQIGEEVIKDIRFRTG